MVSFKSALGVIALPLLQLFWASTAASSPTISAPTSLAAIPSSTLTQITNFGTNPNNVLMFVYKPAKVAAKPALIVASHCTSPLSTCLLSVSDIVSGSLHRHRADILRRLQVRLPRRNARLRRPLPVLRESPSLPPSFPAPLPSNLPRSLTTILIRSQPHPGTCWDVSSTATLTHNGGGDSLGIASAARFALANWGVDPARVFAAGTSSGAMMTSVLAGAYPDVFRAGVVDSGVAFGCFALPGQPGDSWNEQCALGELVLTGQQWAQRVFDAFPGFSGARPRMQVWHGTA